MASAGEAALAALFAVLPTPAGGAKARNESDELPIPAGGKLILRDGDRGEPIEEQLNPPAAIHRHAASLQILVENVDDAARTTALDALADGVRAVLAADRTLGGAVDWAELRRGTPRDVTEPGAAPIRIEDATIVLEYQEEI
jgi:hypothetical protein